MAGRIRISGPLVEPRSDPVEPGVVGTQLRDGVAQPRAGAGVEQRQGVSRSRRSLGRPFVDLKSSTTSGLSTRTPSSVTQVASSSGSNVVGQALVLPQPVDVGRQRHVHRPGRRPVTADPDLAVGLGQVGPALGQRPDPAADVGPQVPAVPRRAHGAPARHRPASTRRCPRAHAELRERLDRVATDQPPRPVEPLEEGAERPSTSNGCHGP